MFGIEAIAIPEFVTRINIGVLLRTTVLLFLAWPLVFVLGRWATRYFSRGYGAQQGMIAGKVIQYGGTVLVLVLLLYELGFSLAPLLGAAGIVGIALGFASQTSVSNIISGLFLMAERPFVVDDVVTVGAVTGQVLSIDILSIKIRTFDNRYVRIPNENIIKAELTNITRFPIRRFDLPISVAYKEDLTRVKEVLFDVAKKNPLALQEPEAQVHMTGFGASGIDFLFVVWTIRPDFLQLKNSLLEEIKLRFDQEGIEIPFPHLSIYAGSQTEPFPVDIKQNS